MTSDFFLEEADDWRDEAWSIIERRPDVKFFLLTKRPDRVAEHLPFNWGGARPCHYEWVKSLRDECEAYNVTFIFCGTGRRFYKDGKLYKIEEQGLQSEQAHLSGLSFIGKPMKFDVSTDWILKWNVK